MSGFPKLIYKFNYLKPKSKSKLGEGLRNAILINKYARIAPKILKTRVTSCVWEMDESVHLPNPCKVYLELQQLKQHGTTAEK